MDEESKRLIEERMRAERLQSVATRLLGTRGTSELYQEILESASAILHADVRRQGAQAGPALLSGIDGSHRVFYHFCRILLPLESHIP